MGRTRCSRGSRFCAASRSSPCRALRAAWTGRDSKTAQNTRRVARALLRSPDAACALWGISIRVQTTVTHRKAKNIRVERKLRKMTTSSRGRETALRSRTDQDTFDDNELEKTGITVLTRRARSEAREEGLSEERSQAKQTDILRARGPRGLELRCWPVPKPHTG